MAHILFILNIFLSLIFFHKIAILGALTTYTRNPHSQGCISHPEVPVGGILNCNKNRSCIARCFDSYRFPDGESEIAIECSGSKWQIVTGNYLFVPPCEAICTPKCLNNGYCIEPNKCNCTEHFSGPQCQFEKKPSSNIHYPVLYNVNNNNNNNQKSCNKTTCTWNCVLALPAFPDGSFIASLICK